jgi:peptidoglycan/LPS O-acetylase OafA/YrhL
LLLRCILIGIYSAPLLRIAFDALLPGNWLPAFVLMPCRADALLLGVLAAILLRDPQWKERFQRGKLFWAIAFPVFLLGIALLSWKHSAPFDPVQAAAGYSWLALFYASVLVYSLTHSDSFLARALRIKWLGWLGSIAYGTYLIHQMIQGMFFGFQGKDEPAITGGFTLLTTLAALALTLVIARLSWRFFESPLVRFGHRSKYEFADSGTNSGTKGLPADEPRLVCP